jgi:transcriptional regulator with XRE-family HTH domain
MRAALDTWHMGKVFFAYRTHLRHPRPLSQELIGNWLGLTQVQVGRIEKGRAPEELSKLTAWARILGIPGDLLWFRLPHDESEGWRVQPIGTTLTIVGTQLILLLIDADAARASGLLDQAPDQERNAV